MTDYTELIRSLRNCSNNRCAPCDCGWFDKYQVDESCKEIIMWKAADAIEALQAEVERLEPKRGEIVRCKECIHFTQGGWCDREFDWFPVDKNDFCSMAEKIEVQDGANRGF